MLAGGCCSGEGSVSFLTVTLSGSCVSSSERLDASVIMAAKVLTTVDEGTTFDILEILDNGWTKILYEGSEAYISSSYVIIMNE